MLLQKPQSTSWKHLGSCRLALDGSQQCSRYCVYLSTVQHPRQELGFWEQVFPPPTHTHTYLHIVTFHFERTSNLQNDNKNSTKNFLTSFTLISYCLQFAPFTLLFSFCVCVCKIFSLNYLRKGIEVMPFYYKYFSVCFLIKKTFSYRSTVQLSKSGYLQLKWY